MCSTPNIFGYISITGSERLKGKVMENQRYNIGTEIGPESEGISNLVLF